MNSTQPQTVYLPNLFKYNPPVADVSDISEEHPQSKIPSIDITVEQSVEEIIETSGRYSILKRTTTHFVAPPGLIEDLLKKTLQYSYEEQGHTTAYTLGALEMERVRARLPTKTWSELRCGDMLLPLRKHWTNLRHLAMDYFGIDIPQGANERAIQKLMVREYIRLEGIAAKGTLLQDQERKWHRICQVVDRKEAIRKRELATPERLIAEVIKTDKGLSVRALDGRELLLIGNAKSSIEFIECGEWFEGEAYRDASGSVVDLKSVRLLNDYAIAKSEEIGKFFNKTQQ